MVTCQTSIFFRVASYFDDEIWVLGEKLVNSWYIYIIEYFHSRTNKSGNDVMLVWVWVHYFVMETFFQYLTKSDTIVTILFFIAVSVHAKSRMASVSWVTRITKRKTCNHIYYDNLLLEFCIFNINLCAKLKYLRNCILESCLYIRRCNQNFGKPM